MAEKQVVAFGPFKDFIADGVRVGDTIQLSGRSTLSMSHVESVTPRRSHDEGKASLLEE